MLKALGGFHSQHRKKKTSMRDSRLEKVEDRISPAEEGMRGLLVLHKKTGDGKYK
jgi:hypothetical protein